jgi:cytochrome b subunit of formate dehydrogenase
MSIHGKGLMESGLMVTAVCTSCHSSHSELPASDPQSSVNPQNIGKTCAQCHLGIYEQFKSSIHSPEITKTDKKLPTCHDCHNAHAVDRIDNDSFRQQILAECGTCHEEVTITYFETYHGKVSLLGSGKTAKCSDCHGAHDVLPPEFSQSKLSRQNVVETCKKCHPNSNRQFTGYLSHATHHNKAKYPFLFYSFWAMTVLLVTTFTIFGIHTLLWLPRSFIQRFKLHKKLRSESKSYYVRFERIWRVLHVIVIISFFSLALTGMILKFAGTTWAVFFANLLGGFENAGLIHRIGAILTFIYFAVHFFYVYQNWKQSGKTLRQFIFDKDTGMAPTWNDLKEFFQTIRWFFTGKKQPNYGRWTYWEKFDYLAVFWGVAMIGFTGLILWFPEFFTKFLPGYFINIATIIHSDEALLATGFIFTFHFFNTHFRPEKFPMDPVIFTGKVPLEEFKIDRPREYEMVKDDGTFRKKLSKAPAEWLTRLSFIFGISCLVFGYLLIGMIIWAMIFQYK